MNRERRKELAKVFFDIGKYLLTVAGVGSVISKNYDIVSLVIAGIASFIMLTLAYYVTPLDK